MAQYMKGSLVAWEMLKVLGEETARLRAEGIIPKLAIVRLGARPDDLAYERSAMSRCQAAGIVCETAQYPADITEEALCDALDRLSGDPLVHGILLMRPLPGHIGDAAVKTHVSPVKDVDCITAENEAKIFGGDQTGFAPCTAEAVMRILRHYKIPLEGRHTVVIGRSMVVGKPLSMLLLGENATVTVCHTRTRELPRLCREAEVLCAAAGRAGMVTKEYLAPRQILVDVGISVEEDGTLRGDLDFSEAERTAAWVTPVQDGVGTVTAAVLAEHVVRAARRLSRPV